MSKPFTGPPPIYVFVTVPADPKRGISEAFTGRVGTCATEAEIAGLIAKDKRAMADTFGGLIDGVSTKGRVYRAFRAEWTEVLI